MGGENSRKTVLDRRLEQSAAESRRRALRAQEAKDQARRDAMDAQSEKKDAQPAEKPAAARRTIVQKIVGQNLPLGGISRRLPPVRGRRASGITAEGPTKEDAKADRQDRRSVLEALLRHANDLDKWDREDVISRRQMASNERIAAMRQGPRVYKFTASMNGSGGVNYRVRYKDIGKGGVFGASSGSPGYDSETVRGPSGPSNDRFGALVDRLLAMYDREPQGRTRGVSVTETRSRARDQFDFSDWMPKDLEKDKGKAYAREDFLGLMDTKRSMRFGGGYLDPGYRDRYIEWAMRGLQPGDPGYAQRYEQSKAMWLRVASDLDRRWGDYGDTVMRGQTNSSAAKAASQVAGKEPSDVAAAAVKAQTDRDRSSAAASDVAPAAVPAFTGEVKPSDFIRRQQAGNPNWGPPLKTGARDEDERKKGGGNARTF